MLEDTHALLKIPQVLSSNTSPLAVLEESGEGSDLD
jgi:hypothetical protein